MTTEQTLPAGPIDVPVGGPPSPERPRRRPTPLALATSYPWVFAAMGLLLFALIAILWARARPGYDPYGWLVWGKLTIHGRLDTNGAPSWKPLPFLFTVPFAVFGRYQLWLWMCTAVAISFAGPVFAWRIAFRLTDADPPRRYAAYAAGLFAAVSMLAMQDTVAHPHLNYLHYIFSAESDTMLVSLCLAAVDCHLNGRHRWAFWLWWLGALGRPEVWPYYGLAGIFLWVKMPAYRKWVIASVPLLVFLWFGIPGLTSKSALTAGNLAQNSPRKIHGNRIIGTLGRFHELNATTVWIAAALAVVLALYRRERAILTITVGAAVWVVIEAAFALHGFPAVPRYMFEPGAIVDVLAGLFVGRLILMLPPLLSGLARRVHTPRVSARMATLAGTWGTVLVLIVVVASMAGAVHTQYRLERVDLTGQRARTVLFDRISGLVKHLGGTSRILACGQPNIPIEYQSALAWYMNVKIGELYVSFTKLKVHPHPLINIYPIGGNGWEAFTSNVSAAQTASCNAVVPAGRTLFFRGS